MSRLGLSAVLVALLSATAASACCFFKCCWKPAPYPYPHVTPGADPRFHPSAWPTTSTSLLTIISVDGQAPVSGSISNPVNRPKIEVVVRSEFDPSTSNPELIVTDDGLTTAKAVAKNPSVKYKHKRIVKKPRPKPVGPAPAAGPVPLPSPGPAPGPGPVPDPIPDPSFFWEIVFEVDVSADHRYSAYATAGTAASSSVSFRAKP